MVAMNTSTNYRNQNWGDDLRLPTCMDPLPIVTEVLEPLRRISLPFQNKHLPVLKRGSWYALKRPVDRSRTGLLCLWPERQAAIFVGSDRARTRVALLRLRVDPQFYAAGAGVTVFAATMCPASRELLMEDVLMWKGADVGNSLTFTKRSDLLSQWLDHYCEVDARLIGGLQVRAAAWTSLDAVTPDGVWEFQQDEAGRRRLMWLPPRASTVADSVASLEAIPASPFVPTTTTPSPEEIPNIQIDTLVAIATKEAGPEQWSLKSSDGISLGRALIRTFAVSAALRSCSSGVAHVTVEWNPQFSKWEVLALSTGEPLHSSFFTTHK